MDKIREEFEKEYPKPICLEYNSNRDEYLEDIKSPISMDTMTFYNARYEVYKFCGKEIKKLKDALLILTIRDDWSGEQCREFSEKVLTKLHQ